MKARAGVSKEGRSEVDLTIYLRILPENSGK